MIPKFRFRSVGGMHEVVEIDFKNQKVWLSDGDQRDIASGVLMQSTGLIDKNGKEIYEGDIIEENIHFGHLMSYDFVPKYKEEKGTALYQVVRNQERTKFELVYISHKKREPRTKILDIYNAHKIVGNIYKNPELINR